jgi:hypothetical protein
MTPRISRLAIATAAPLAALALLTAARVPNRVRVAGSFTMAYTQQHPVPVGEAEGHVLLATQASGTNRNIGPTSFMDGAAVQITETADLTNGNGPHQGYVMMSLNGEVLVTKWSGRITTVLGSDKQPITTAEGSYSNVSGTKGSGMYKVRFTGPQSYIVDWQGEMEPGTQASR